jgi:hypothetical protein
MRALHFAKPLEYRLETAADQLTQGDTFAGKLMVTNRGEAPLADGVLDIALAYGRIRNLKAGEQDAFETVTRHRLAEGLTVAPGDAHEAGWEFTLARDCPISTKEGTLFLLYGGNLDQPQGWGRIDLQVVLHPVLETLVGTIETQFHFEARGRKNVADAVEVRFKPPASYPTMKDFYARVALRGDTLEVTFRAALKSLARGGAKGVRTRAEQTQRSLAPGAYLIGNAHPDRIAMKALIGEALRELLPTLAQ